MIYFRVQLCKLLPQSMVIFRVICSLSSVFYCVWTTLLSPFLVCTVLLFAVISGVCKLLGVKYIFLDIKFLKSRKQFLWYLKSDNFKLMLILFPVLAFFPSSCSSLPPFLPSPLSLPWILLLRSYKMVDPRQSVSSIRQNVFTRRVLTDSVPPVFQFAQVIRLLSISCFLCLIWSSEHSWRCLIRTCVVVVCALLFIYLQLVNNVSITIPVISGIG